MKLTTLIIDLGAVCESARTAMNAIDSFREVQRELGREMTREETWCLRAIYGSARKMLKASKRTVEGYGRLWGRDRDDLAKEFDRAIMQIEEEDAKVAAGLQASVGETPSGRA